MRPIKLLSFIVVVILFASCATEKQAQDNQAEGQQAEQKTTYKKYENTRYNIVLNLPKHWATLEEQNLPRDQYVINIFSKNDGAKLSIPLGVHESASLSYITIWPKGLTAELPPGRFGDYKGGLDLKFAVNRDDSKQLMLKDGTVWAYFIVPKNPPSNWLEHGFIYAQFKVKNENIACVDKQTGGQKSMENCDTLDGDRVIRTGRLAEREAGRIRHILESIQLKKGNARTESSNLIKIEQPLPHSTVASPLTVIGEARGSWYFEGSFPVRLVDASGRLLAKGLATAQKPWITNDFVPFKVRLTYEDVPRGSHGRLLLLKANPSGLKKHDTTFSISVSFK